MAYSDYSDYIIYVDESGDNDLVKIDGEYPVFVLDFCIFTKNHYNTFFVPKMQALKFDHFGHDNVILHGHKIRKQIEHFTFLRDERRRDCFMDGLNELIQKVEVSIVAVVINKPKYKEKHINPWDPYMLAMLLCMERAYLFLEEKGQHAKTTHIIVERRGKKEDNELGRAFHRICAGDYPIQLYPMPNFEIEFADKQGNFAGLQLADLTAHPIGKHVINPQQPNRSWNIMNDKIHRGGPQNQMEGYGLKVLP